MSTTTKPDRAAEEAAREIKAQATSMYLDLTAAIISRHYSPLVEAVNEYLEWGAMTGSDRDLFERKFRSALEAVRGKQ